MSRFLLLAMSLVEVAMGAALLIAPSLVVERLLGEELTSPQSLVLGRVTGAALISISAACWFARDFEPGGRRGLVRSMLIYNVAVPVLLIYAKINFGLQGILFWPGCVLHSGLSIWCVLCIHGR